MQRETNHVRWLFRRVAATGALTICGVWAADYREVLAGPSPSLSLNVEVVDPGTGTARANGVDSPPWVPRNRGWGFACCPD